MGLSLAQERYPSTWQWLTNAAPDLVLFLSVGALLGIAGSLLLSRLIKRRTHGLEPQVAALLTSVEDSQDVAALVGTRVLVFNQRSASSRGSCRGRAQSDQ